MVDASLTKTKTVTFSDLTGTLDVPATHLFLPSLMLARANQPTHFRRGAYEWLRSMDSELVILGFKNNSDLALYVTSEY